MLYPISLSPALVKLYPAQDGFREPFAEKKQLILLYAQCFMTATIYIIANMYFP